MNYFIIKRKIDKLLSEGHGRQFIWLFIVTILCVVTAIGISRFIFNDSILVWQDIVGLFLDPGVFGSFATKGHDFFRLILALLSVFLFSALLVSVFTNVFENISVSVRGGQRRYNVKDHILILGTGHYLKGLLRTLDNEKHIIVVMSEQQADVDGKYIYYNGHIDEEDDLTSARANKADTIYIIGDDNNENHDDQCLKALEILNRLCKDAEKDIHCFVVVNEHETTEVIQFQKKQESGHLLLVDVLNENNFVAEQLIANDTFLPVIKSNEDTKSEIVIFGTNKMAHAIAYTAAHISHYPNYTTKGIKTRITFVGEDMKRWMDDFIATRPLLFSLSAYEFIASDGESIVHNPECEYGDFLDIEWRFIDNHASSSLVKKMLVDMVCNKKVKLSTIVCNSNTQTSIKNALHMPPEVYGRYNTEGAYRIAVYLREESNIIERANATGMYGNIIEFGLGNYKYITLDKRSEMGKRVNYIYDKKYNKVPSANADEAWYKISETDKYSSIFCASALPLRAKCFEGEKNSSLQYNVEHNRWVMSELLMGSVPGKVRDKAKFIHNDIVPFNKLPLGEQVKDKIIIDAIESILRGE